MIIFFIIELPTGTQSSRSDLKEEDEGQKESPPLLSVAGLTRRVSANNGSTISATFHELKHIMGQKTTDRLKDLRLKLALGT